MTLTTDRCHAAGEPLPSARWLWSGCDDQALQRTSSDAAQERLVIALIKTGDEDREAFRELYILTSAKLFGICLTICGDQQAAEDVMHDVYLIIWKRAGAFEPGRASPITWLATIARNRSIDWWRKQRVRRAITIEDAPDLPDMKNDAETALIHSEGVRRLHDCLAGLPARQHNAIRAAFFFGYTYAELAEREGVPLSTMKSWVRRGLLQLRTGLQEVD